MQRTKQRAATRLGLALSGAALAFAAACGGAGSPEDASQGPRWVELDENAIAVENLDLGDKINTARSGPEAPVSVSAAEAEAQLPFDLGLPTWVPPGFEQDALVEVVTGEGFASVLVTWLNGSEDIITLQAAQGALPALGQAGFGQVEAVAVNGLPASLTRTMALGPERLSLSWNLGDVAYTLSTDGNVRSADLLKMAESIGAG